MTEFEIRQELDQTRLEHLSEQDREAADELGELDGNQHYIDLSLATWDDVAYALREEGRLMELLQDCDDPSATLAMMQEAAGAQEERDMLWYLELGVAAPVMALNALGAHTALSCNGAAFGGVHLRDRPSIRFYPGDAAIDQLLELARDSGAGLVDEDGRALLYAHTVLDLQRFATLALERYGTQTI